MLASLTLPIEPVTGITSAMILFFAMAIGHAVADFPLQGDFLARGKNRHLPAMQLADGKDNPKFLWAYLMTAHCLIHAGFVWVITGSAFLGFIELVVHWAIDAVKCENKTSFEVDQWLHLITKAIYVGLIWGGIVSVS